VLANLDVIGNPPSFIESGQALSIERCQGVVVVQDCDLQGGGDLPDSPTINGGTGAWILDAAEVAFVRTDVLGGNAPVGEAPSDCIFNPTLGMDGGPGVHAQASTVYAYDSTFGGGDGEPDGDQGGKGASGFFVEVGASLFASRCAFLGGDGGSGFFVGECEATGGDGGPGLKAAGHAAAVEVLLAGGAGGDGLYGHGADGPPSAGEVFIAMGLGRSLLAPSLVQSPADLAVELQGVGGELAYLLVSPALDPALILFGVLLAPAPTLIPLGALPPGGSLPLVLPLPPLPPGLEHMVLHAQGLFVDPTGAIWPRLSGFSTLVWL
jgi:hypothetical protein